MKRRITLPCEARLPRAASICLVVSVLTLGSFAADANNQVQLDVSKASPRTVESLTQRVIQRDYTFAWTMLAQAMESNSAGPLNGPFVGSAKEALVRSVARQRESGVSARYTNQSHKVEAVFYSPEGDAIELHDTAEYQLQIVDGDKVIDEERVSVHYVVLMSPGADRWVVRQIQAVPQF